MVESNPTHGFWPSLRQMSSRLADLFSPPSEASTAEDAYRIAMELPGVQDDDVELTVHEGVVTVKGEKRSRREESGESWYFSEREYGAFSRSFRLPGDADAEKVDAELKDGVLTVIIPKRAPDASDGGTRIAIKRG